ncbi:hypothetical protein CNR22_16015 [Sphingobacteriaceae bacterium]|nr:hypothetical protein CNR22_16015 [Sphingobacteriaceae bacterium]
MSPENPSFGETIVIDPGCTRDAESWVYSVDGESIGGSEEFTGDEAGEYVVTLTAYSRREGGKTDEVSHSIFVSDKAGIVTNSPVSYDQTITLEAKTGRYASYDWKGPNNFTSDQRSVSIHHANAGSAGIYSLVVSINGKSSATSTVNINVTPLNAGCNPANNQCTYTGGIIGGTATVTSYVNSDQYEMAITNNANFITLRFNTASAPFPGMYEVTQNFFDIQEGQVYMDIVPSGNLQQTAIGAGKVFIALSEGKVNAVFCNIPFTYLDNKFTVSGKVTEP